MCNSLRAHLPCPWALCDVCGVALQRRREKKMKTDLTTKQSARLIELGVDRNYASSAKGMYTIGSPARELDPIFSLTDLLTIIPKWIKYRHYLLWLNMGVDQYDERWWCAYKDIYDNDEDETYKSAPELIDALYELLVGCIEEKLINDK